MVKIIIPLLLLALALSACAPANPPQPATAPTTPAATPAAVIASTASTPSLPPPTSLPSIATATSLPAPLPTCPCESRPTVTQSLVVTESPAEIPQKTANAPADLVPLGNLYTVVGVSMDDVLNLRSQPGVEFPILGTIPPDGSSIERTGSDQKVNGVAWTPVAYQGLTGWVNAKYLAKQSGNPDAALAKVAMQAIQAIKQKDFKGLATLVDPQGLRFSPYTFVGPENLSFSPTRVSNLFSDPTIYHWGVFDGSGQPIELTFKDYYKRFIYDVDFAQPEAVGFNVAIGGGSTINNVAEFYPESQVVEYYFSGFDPKYSGMDWRSLRLVFLPSQGDYTLAGIVHDEWGP